MSSIPFTLVIIPSIRAIHMGYIRQLLVPGVDLLVVDDANGAVRFLDDDGDDWSLAAAAASTPPSVTIYKFHRAQIEEWMVLNGWEAALGLIPEKNPSCKNFGLFYAWACGYERIILLDDDCDTRITPDFLSKVPLGKPMPPWSLDTHSGWVNPTALLSDSPFFSRGYPYECRHESQHIVATKLLRHKAVEFNEGLWSGTPDINGIDKVQFQRTQPDSLVRITQTRTMLFAGEPNFGLKPLARLPLSIMNVQMATTLVPYFYQPPDYALSQGWRIRRHDDVWASLLLGHFQPQVGRTVGGPLIWHRKAGDEIAELLSEHPTNLAQQSLMAVLDADPTGTPLSVLRTAERLFEPSIHNQLHAAVLTYLRAALLWSDIFKLVTFGCARTY